jgi:hypothetical protein
MPSRITHIESRCIAQAKGRGQHRHRAFGRENDDPISPPPREVMMTPLDRPLRREINIEGTAYTVTLDPFGLKLTRKAHRNGVEMRWTDLLKDDATTTAAHHATPPDDALQ